MRLEGELGSLAEAGDPAAAPRLRELSLEIRSLWTVSERLREALSSMRG
jgi:hypothetical protein